MRRAIIGVVGVVAILAAACSTADAGADASDVAGTTPTRADVVAAIDEWRPRAEAMLDDTGVPGMAVAIVFEDEVLFSAGFGVRKIGENDPIDADTVFQLASLSKPIASTVVAGLVGDGVVEWDDPIVGHDPGFQLNDELVTEQATFADLFSHRSGLPDHAGDLLEDLGYSRAEIIDRLRLLPLAPFRAEYGYTNFGLTEAAVVAARASGRSWEEASSSVLYEPAGMENTSSVFTDYIAATNRAVPHTRVDGRWTAAFQRQPDSQSPAGGVSSTVGDLTRWMRLTLADGSLDGVPIIDPEALAETKVPHMLVSPSAGAGRPPTFYGLGWGVKQDTSGRIIWSHSGGFLLGAGTNVILVPNEQLGIVTLTNGEAIGLAESVSQTFMDLLLLGDSPDWLARYEPLFAEIMRPPPDADYTVPPPDARLPGPTATYEGTYGNGYFGDLAVSVEDGALVMTLGPDDMTFPLTPYDGDTFFYQPTGENGVNPSAVTFTVDGGVATAVLVEHLDGNGLGSFVRP